MEERLTFCRSARAHLAFYLNSFVNILICQANVSDYMEHLADMTETKLINKNNFKHLVEKFFFRMCCPSHMTNSQILLNPLVYEYSL